MFYKLSLDRQGMTTGAPFLYFMFHILPVAGPC